MNETGEFDNSPRIYALKGHDMREMRKMLLYYFFKPVRRVESKTQDGF